MEGVGRERLKAIRMLSLCLPYLVFFHTLLLSLSLLAGSLHQLLIP